MEEFPAAVDHLSEMLTYVHSQAQAAGMDRTHIHRIELASEEALVNIISYAFPRDASPSTLIISCQNQSDRFEVTIRDHGIPFNPIDREINVEIDKPLNERKIGGLGIFLIRRLIDDITYQRTEDQNILTMTINL